MSTFQFDSDAEKSAWENVKREVFDGLRTPADAELWARDQQTVPFVKDFRSWEALEQEPFWPLELAIIYIVWRRPRRIARAWASFQVWRENIWLNPESDQQKSSLIAARGEMNRALQAGTLTAYGKMAPDQPVEKIPAFEWYDLSWDHSRDHVYSSSDSMEVRYRSVIVAAEEVGRLWPLVLDNKAESATTEASPKASKPRNKGGRPEDYDWDAMWIEVIRLALDGQIASRASLHRHLAGWFSERFDSEPGDSTLRGKLSKLYLALGWDEKS